MNKQRCIDVATTINMLTDTREELMEEDKSIPMKKASKCYITNIIVAGIVTSALIDTGAEVTCISEEFFNANKERFSQYPCLPLAGVAVTGPMGGKAVRLTRQIYADVQLPNNLVQFTFLIVPKLTRTCIIGIDILDEHKTIIDLDEKTLTFPHMDGKPAIRIMQDKGSESLEGQCRVSHVEFTVNSLSELENIPHKDKLPPDKPFQINITWPEIQEKVDENPDLKLEEKEKLGKILWKHRTVFRREPGL